MTTFEALAEPSRRRILDLLVERERPVGELVERIGLSQPGVLKHLQVLREAGLVRSRDRGPAARFTASARRAAFRRGRRGLEPLPRLWRGSSTPSSGTSTTKKETDR